MRFRAQIAALTGGFDQGLSPSRGGLAADAQHGPGRSGHGASGAKESPGSAAAEQAKVAELEREKADLHRQIASLEPALGQEKGRASKLEGRLEVMEAQVVPSTSAEMKAKLARKGIGGRPE